MRALSATRLQDVIVARRDQPSPILEWQVPVLRLLYEAECGSLMRFLDTEAGAWEVAQPAEHHEGDDAMGCQICHL